MVPKGVLTAEDGHVIVQFSVDQANELTSKSTTPPSSLINVSANEVQAKQLISQKQEQHGTNHSVLQLDKNAYNDRQAFYEKRRSFTNISV